MVRTREQSRMDLSSLFIVILQCTTTSPAFKSLAYEGIETIFDFINLSETDVDGFEVEENGQVKPIAKKDKRKIKQLLLWTKYLHKTHSTNNWQTLEQADFDAFMSDIAPTLSSSGSPDPKDAASKFQSNIKLDVKLYPTFDGKVSEWLKFKRGILSIASTHGLDDIFDPSFSVPNEGNGQDWLLFPSQE